MVDQDFGIDVCSNFRDSRLKLWEASFSAIFRMSIISNRKYKVTSHFVRTTTTTPADGPYDNRAKRLLAFCLIIVIYIIIIIRSLPDFAVIIANEKMLL